jgi:uncharacterized protein YecT (DUF1311 family)
MKTAFLVVALALLATVIVRPSPAAALNCARAVLPVENALCSTAELRRADDEMSVAYFKLLGETKDPDFHALLIKSQRRWLERRRIGGYLFVSPGDGKTDIHGLLLQWTRARRDFLASGKPIRTMEAQRRIAANDSGGRYAGYDAGCDFRPPPESDWSYDCSSSLAVRQHHDRICSDAQALSEQKPFDIRGVSRWANGRAVAVARCWMGDDRTIEPCPDPAQTDALKPTAHWKLLPPPLLGLLPDRPGVLWKYDPDLEPGQYEQPWMDACLSAPVFPPPEQSRP